ncbi:MAG TPA: type II secretion system protein [Allosphingosinicella sp.]|jgi:prepilin-type N-terminal cleavage/methylation domain-containing protein
MNRQAGFTLIELLAAMTAGSLLLVTLSVSVAQLGMQLSRKPDVQAARLEAFAPVFRSLLEQAQPGEKDTGFVGSAKGLRALVEPPMAAALAGPMRLDLAVRPDATGEALHLLLTPLAPGAALPSAATSDRIVAEGFRSIRFTYAAKPSGAAAGLPKLITIAFETTDQKVRSLSAAPRIDSGGTCRFDPISMACR